MKKFDSLRFVKKLISFSPRQLKGEKLAGEFIQKTLVDFGVDFKLQNFRVTIPVYKKYYLMADDRKIKCLPAALKSGKIEGKENIISSLDFSSDFCDIPNINYNPYCPEISLANYYFSPSLAIAPRELKRILKAKKISGKVEIQKLNHKSCNILVGNIKVPETISFAHYDSLETGATDNASGTATIMEAVISNPEILKDNLIVFSGAEEVSFDKPDYWGHGFRIFEKKYKKIMRKVKKIIVVDCVGNGRPRLIFEPKDLFLYFPILNLDEFSKKIFIIAGSDKRLMKVYHSKLDDLSCLRKGYLDMAVKKILSLYRNKCLL